MPDWLNIRVDGLSFFLGIAAGTLFWFLFGQFKKTLFPYLLSVSKRKFQEFRDRNFIGANIAIRQDVLKRAQKAHLAAQLFALDEILIPPRLIPPPPLIDPAQENDPENLPISSFPYLPDWPEISSNYQNDLSTLPQLAAKNANLVVVGQPGTGKSVCLAQYACELARIDSTQNSFFCQSSNLPAYRRLTCESNPSTWRTGHGFFKTSVFRAANIRSKPGSFISKNSVFRIESHLSFRWAG